MAKKGTALHLRKAPHPMLLALVAQFLENNGFNSSHRIYNTERRKRPKKEGWEGTFGRNYTEKFPPLEAIFQTWKHDHCEEGPDSETKMVSIPSLGTLKDLVADGGLTKNENHILGAEPAIIKDFLDNSLERSALEEQPIPKTVFSKNSLQPTVKSLKRKASDVSSESVPADSETSESEGGTDRDRTSRITKKQRLKSPVSSLRSSPDSTSETSSDSTSDSGSDTESTSESDSSSDSNSDSDSDSDSSSKVASGSRKLHTTELSIVSSGRDNKNIERETDTNSDSDSSSGSESGPRSPQKVLASTKVIATKLQSLASGKSSLASSASNSLQNDKFVPTKNPPPFEKAPSDSSGTITGDVKVKENSLTSDSGASQPSTKITEVSNVKKKHLGAQPTKLGQLSASADLNKYVSNTYVSYEYADKAFRDLSVTRGKGFTKEKNKKKRGSYRGGAIDISGGKGFKFEE